MAFTLASIQNSFLLDTIKTELLFILGAELLFALGAETHDTPNLKLLSLQPLTEPTLFTQFSLLYKLFTVLTGDFLVLPGAPFLFLKILYNRSIYSHVFSNTAMKTKVTNDTRTAQQRNQLCLTKISTKDEQIQGVPKTMRKNKITEKGAWHYEKRGI
jgi:hypothetical protein